MLGKLLSGIVLSVDEVSCACCATVGFSIEIPVQKSEKNTRQNTRTEVRKARGQSKAVPDFSGHLPHAELRGGGVSPDLGTHQQHIPQ